MSNGETQSAATPGTMLAGKYRVERVLGQGGMGMVVAAHHIALDERVALKLLLPELAKNAEASARFQREARAAVKIKSEHVARVSDVGTLEGGAPYMVMELLDGSDLAAVLARQGVLSLGDAVDYIVQGCEAIAEAHGLGIIHRDLKPANLFLSKRPDGSPLIKVLDFGISKISGVESFTKTSASMGSAYYSSPEQLLQAKTVDTRTDVYALGVTLYELLTGRRPFHAETLPELCSKIVKGTPVPLSDLRPDLPPEVSMILEKAYARERDQRYPSIAAFVMAIAPYALPRSGTSIERIMRMAGLPVPEGVGRVSWPGSGGSSPAGVGSSSPVVSSPAMASSAPVMGSSAPAGAASPRPAINPFGGTQIMDEATWNSAVSPVAPKPSPDPLVATMPLLPVESSAFAATIPLGSQDVAAAVAAAQQAPLQQVSPVQQASSEQQAPLQPSPPPEQVVQPVAPPPQQVAPIVAPPLDMHQILPGHYTGPMSTRAAAHFKMGARAPRPQRSGGAIVLAFLVLVAVGIIAAAFLLRRRPAGPSSAPEPALSGAAPASS